MEVSKSIYKWLCVILGVISFGAIIYGTVMKKKKDKAENDAMISNIILTDSLTIYRNKEREEYKMRQSYIVKIEELKLINDSLYREYKKLKENPIVITKNDIEFRVDTLYIRDNIIRDSLGNGMYVDFWKYSDRCIYLEGKYAFNPSPRKSYILFNKIKADATIYTSIIEKDKKLQIISRTNNPYIQLTDINGGIISNGDTKVLNRYFTKRKPWNISLTAGYYVICSLPDNTVKTGPGIGISIGYSFLSW